MSSTYDTEITEPLRKLGIKPDRQQIEFVIKLIAKEVFKYDEKEYLNILKKYDLHY